MPNIVVHSCWRNVVFAPCFEMVDGRDGFMGLTPQFLAGESSGEWSRLGHTTIIRGGIATSFLGEPGTIAQ